MAIKIRMHGEKATVRFKDKKDRDFFIFFSTRARDVITDPPHPEISVKDENGHEIKIK